MRATSTRETREVSDRRRRVRGGVRRPSDHDRIVERIRITEVELSKPIPAVPHALPTGREHDRVRSLVRLHSSPLGLIDFPLDRRGLTPAEHGAMVWRAVGGAINEHLVADGLAPVSDVPPGGLVNTGEPTCLTQRRQAALRAPFATVVVPTRDRTESLATCLNSLLNLDYPEYEIIVIDNRPSTPATEGLLAERFHDETRADVRYVRQDGPLAVARNRGARDARGDIVAFTDDDVVVDRWWLLELARRFEDDRVACVTGMILPAELETAPQVWLEQYGGFSKGFQRQLFDLHENRPATRLFPYAAGMFGSGANMAFRRAVLEDLDGFDPATGPGTYARGGEDLAVFFDVVAAGYSLAYEPGALVYHHHRDDYNSLRDQAFDYGVGLGAYLMKTLANRPSRIVDFVRWLPFGFVYLLSPTSAKNASKRADYPRELTWLERKGLIYGPIAYLRSRLRTKHRGRVQNRRRGETSTGS
jgi:O-antigen biosynthesis protein